MVGAKKAKLEDKSWEKETSEMNTFFLLPDCSHIKTQNQVIWYAQVILNVRLLDYSFTFYHGTNIVWEPTVLLN